MPNPQFLLKKHIILLIIWNVKYVTGPRRQIPGGIVHIRSIDGWDFFIHLVSNIDFLTVCPYGLFLCLYARKNTPVTSTFLLNNDWYIIGKLEWICFPWIIIPLRVTPPGYVRDWTFPDNWTAWCIPQTKIVSSKNWDDYNLGAHSTSITQFYLSQN